MCSLRAPGGGPAEEHREQEPLGQDLDAEESVSDGDHASDDERHGQVHVHQPVHGLDAARERPEEDGDAEEPADAAQHGHPVRQIDDATPGEREAPLSDPFPAHEGAHGRAQRPHHPGPRGDQRRIGGKIEDRDRLDEDLALGGRQQRVDLREVVPDVDRAPDQDRHERREPGDQQWRAPPRPQGRDRFPEGRRHH